MIDWVDRPVPFSGTREEAVANHQTHNWVFDGDVLVCLRCDSKSWHEAASYPCGVEPLREIVPVDTEEFLSSIAVRAAAAHEIDSLF